MTAHAGGMLISSTTKRQPHTLLLAVHDCSAFPTSLLCSNAEWFAEIVTVLDVQCYGHRKSWLAHVDLLILTLKNSICVDTPWYC